MACGLPPGERRSSQLRLSALPTTGANGGQRNLADGAGNKASAGIKIAGRNINNLRYADDTTLMAESEEELKSLLMKVKERVKKLA